jgi:hypothetical protein
MADRILTWSCKRCDGNPTVMLPAYYLEKDFDPVAVRIRAESAPTASEAVFEIYADGVPIMNDYSFSYSDYIIDTQHYSGNYDFTLTKTETTDDMADDFNGNSLEAGTWVTCVIKEDGSGKNFTVQLELDEVANDE